MWSRRHKAIVALRRQLLYCRIKHCLCRRVRCTAAIYVGDDDNDEDAFALAGQAPLLGIRVGHSRRSRAACFLPAQSAVDAFLAKLVDLRQPGRRTA